MKKNDWIVIVSALIITLGFFMFFRVSTSRETVKVSVFLDGEKIAALPLNENPYEYIVENKYGKNILNIDIDGVSVIEADCVSKTCVNFGKLTHTKQVIVCIPHHLTIVLEGMDNEAFDFDAVTN